MLNLKLEMETNGFLWIKKKNQQTKLNGQAAGVVEGEVCQSTIPEDKESTAIGFHSLESQMTFKLANLGNR